MSAYETGERPLPPPGLVLRLGRPAMLPLSSVACVRTTERVVALTYDDGPDPDHTPGILDALAEHGARATFFVLVEAAERHPELLARILAEGHEVGLHGIDHARLTTLPARRCRELIGEGKERLEQAIGRPVTLFRPTYGAQTLGQYRVTRSLGLDVVVWSAWARDWEGASAEVVAERAINSLHRGGIVLLHDASGDGVGAGTGPHDRPERTRATRMLLAGMAMRDYGSRTVGELLATFPAVRAVWAERRARGA